MAESLANISLTVNGQKAQVAADASTPLLWILRDNLGLTETKFGCGQGLCGACTVLLDGEAVRSCQLALKAVKRGKVVTIEGLSADGQHLSLPVVTVEAWVCQPYLINVIFPPCLPWKGIKEQKKLFWPSTKTLPSLTFPKECSMSIT